MSRSLTAADESWHVRTAESRPARYRLHMTRLVLIAISTVGALHYAHCQELGKTPAFDVASITPCKPGTPPNPGEHMGMVRFTAPGGRFSATAIDLAYLFEWAYAIQPAQHSGGPTWMETDRYDFAAKAEGNPTDAEMKVMVQALLADRFKLRFHREQRKLAVLTISTGKTAPKLFPPREGEVQSLRSAPQMGPDQKIASYHIVATRFPISQLIDTLSRPLGEIMVNQTGLTGDFDFTLDLTPDDSRPNPLDASLLLTAMREQLGLVFKSENIPVDFFAIESAQRVVAGNE